MIKLEEAYDVCTIKRAYNLLWNYAYNIVGKDINETFAINIPEECTETASFVSLLANSLIVDNEKVKYITSKYKDIKTLNIYDVNVIEDIFGLKVTKYSTEYDELLCILFAIIICNSESELESLWSDLEYMAENLNKDEYASRDAEIFNIADNEVIELPNYVLIKGECDIRKTKINFYNKLNKIKEIVKTTTEEKEDILKSILSSDIKLPSI